MDICMYSARINQRKIIMPFKDTRIFSLNEILHRYDYQRLISAVKYSLHTNK